MTLGESSEERLPHTRTAAARLLDLLGVFAEGKGAYTLSEISRKADLSLPTAHRLVKEVMSWGGLEIDGSGRYRLSRKILNLASQSTMELRLRDYALPQLSVLHRSTGLTVHLAVRDHNDAMFVDSLRLQSDYTGESRIGGKLPLHATSVGLVLLAHAEQQVIEDYTTRSLRRYTSKTITDPAQLTQVLDDIRRNGVAVAEEFLMLGWTAVAVPITGPSGEVEASVGITCRKARHDVRKLVPALRQTAGRISRSMAEGRVLSEDPRARDFRRRHSRHSRATA